MTPGGRLLLLCLSVEDGSVSLLSEHRGYALQWCRGWVNGRSPTVKRSCRWSDPRKHLTPWLLVRGTVHQMSCGFEGLVAKDTCGGMLQNVQPFNICPVNASHMKKLNTEWLPRFSVSISRRRTKLPPGVLTDSASFPDQGVRHCLDDPCI